MFRRTWRYYVGLLGLLLGLSACVTEDLHEPVSEGHGYLRLELASVATGLSSSPQTKAETISIPAEDIPTASTFTVDIQKGGSRVEGFPKAFSEVVGSSLVLPVGDYTVSAYAGTDEPIQAKPYFFGSTNVTVLPNQQVTSNIEASLANALLVPAVDESLKKHYSSWTLSVKVGTETLELASNTSTNGHLYVQAKNGQSVMGVFKGTNLLGLETTTDWILLTEAAARTQYTIQCNPDLSAFSNIQLTGKAIHTYDNGSLTGTDVALSLNANGAPIDAIDSWDIKVLYNGTTIRTCSKIPNTANTIMDVVSGWPYVPQGSTLSASVTLKSKDVIELPSATMESIPLPTFTATVSGSTSYSVYKASGAAAANAIDGSSIVNISSSVSISSVILDNPNYSGWLKVTYTTDGGGNSGELPYTTDDVTFTGLAWQKHALTATVSFDGETVMSSPVDCYVTGLPYNISFKDNVNPTSWILNNNSSGGGYLILKVTSAYAITPKFHIPDNIQASAYLKAYAYGGTAPGKYTASVIVSASTGSPVTSGNVTSISASNLLPVSNPTQDITESINLNLSTPCVCIYTMGSKPSWSIGTIDFGLVCFQFGLKYE